MAEEATIFQKLAQEFQRAGVPFLLIGGVAVGGYGYARNTLDIDFLVTEENYEKLKPCLSKLQYQEGVRHKNSVRLRSPHRDFIDVDFLFVDPPTFEGLLRESKEIETRGVVWRVPKLEHLFALKLHAIKNNPKARILKDLNDVITLIQENHFDFKTESFKQLCLKYSDQNLYDKMIKILEGGGL